MPHFSPTVRTSPPLALSFQFSTMGTFLWQLVTMEQFLAVCLRAWFTDDVTLSEYQLTATTAKWMTRSRAFRLSFAARRCCNYHMRQKWGTFIIIAESNLFGNKEIVYFDAYTDLRNHNCCCDLIKILNISSYKNRPNKANVCLLGSFLCSRDMRRYAKLS